MPRQAATLVFAVLVFSLSHGAPAAANLKIVPTFIFDAAQSTPDRQKFQSTVMEVIAAFEAHFTNDITVRFTFKDSRSVTNPNSNDYCQDACSEGTPYAITPYATYRTALQGSLKSTIDHSAFMFLPDQQNSPIENKPGIFLYTSTARALGLTGESAHTDGTIWIDTALSDLGPGLKTDAAHEMNELLGLGSRLDGLPEGSMMAPWPQDLFRYKAAHTRSYSKSDPHAYLSFDDGVTPLVYFCQEIPDCYTGATTSTDRGDYGDWTAIHPGPDRTQDAYGGAAPLIDPFAWQNLDVIGYSLIPEPSAGLLLAAGLVGLGVQRRRVR